MGDNRSGICESSIVASTFVGNLVDWKTSLGRQDHGDAGPWRRSPGDIGEGKAGSHIHWDRNSQTGLNGKTGASHEAKLDHKWTRP